MIAVLLIFFWCFFFLKKIIVALQTLPVGRCPSALARRPLPVGPCPSDVARQPLLVGRCPLDVAHRPVAVDRRLFPLSVSASFLYQDQNFCTGAWEGKPGDAWMEHGNRSVEMGQ